MDVEKDKKEKKWSKTKKALVVAAGVGLAGAAVYGSAYATRGGRPFNSRLRGDNPDYKLDVKNEPYYKKKTKQKKAI